MPTGYTATITSDTTRRDFLLTCARAFGACVMQRDDLMGELPKEQAESAYYAEAVTEARAELDAALSRGPLEWEAERQATHADEVRSWIKSEAERAERAEVLSQLRERIVEWEPPTEDHSGIRTFAIEQIDLDLQWEGRETSMPVAPDAATYSNKQITYLRDTLARSERSLAEERERVASRNEWIRALYASLGAEPKS